jgi:tetratricopeptide (TPR) repeat protein
MAKKIETVPVVVPAEKNEALERAKGFWAKYSKPIIYIGGAFILIVGAWFGYKKFIVEPKEEKASEVIFSAENLFGKMANNGFNKDSVGLVLNGGNLEGKKITGVLKIISEYGGTKTANRAAYIAGACYLQIHEYDKAIDYLKKFEANGAEQIQSKAYEMLGYAYSEKKNVDEALSNFKKAANVDPKDEGTVSHALLIAASYAEAMGKDKEAIELYTKLRDNFPKNAAVSSGDVEKHLAKLGVFK